MKNRILSLAISLAILFFYLSTASFGQNQPEKQQTKTINQTTQMNNQKGTKTNQNQKDVKGTENKTVTNKDAKQATVSKNNKNNEQVNTQYHKKEGTTTNGNQQQEKQPVKGDGGKQAK